MHGTGAPLGRFSSEVPDDARTAAQDVAGVLSRAQSVLVCGHAGADGDVAGSSLALACALRELGKDVVVYNELPYPAAFSWLPGGDTVVTQLGPQARFDVTVVVDAARPDRLGRAFPDTERRGTFVWMDHHAIDQAPGDVNFVDLTAAAVGEQVALVLDALGHPISPDVARGLYASLLADTGGFRYANTSARAFRLAARLVEAGVNSWEMTERIYESQDEARVRLLGRALDGLWLSACGRLGLVQVREEDLASTGANEEHVQGLVNHVRAIRGVEVAVLLREQATSTKAVFRSRGNVAIAPIAAALGGRGHKNAGTVILDVTVAEARRQVVDATLPAMDATMAPGAAE